MKNRKINIFATLTLGLIIVLAGCKKDDGPIRSSVIINDVPAVTTSVQSSGSQSIDMLKLDVFRGTFQVSTYFQGATPPDKVDIVVRKNGSSSNVKMFKKDVTTIPATFSVTAAEIASLFGAPIALGDAYDFAPDLYVGVKKYEAFPASIGTQAVTPNNSGIQAYPGFSQFARFAAICAYDPAIYEGDFVVQSDAWGDFVKGDIVKLTKVSNTQFSFKHPYGVGQTPVVATVAANNSVSIPKSSVGSSWSYFTGTYAGAYIITAGAATSSFVAPCAQTLSLNLNYMVDLGTFGGGPYLLVLKKK